MPDILGRLRPWTRSPRLEMLHDPPGRGLNLSIVHDAVSLRKGVMTCKEIASFRPQRRKRLIHPHDGSQLTLSLIIVNISAVRRSAGAPCPGFPGCSKEGHAAKKALETATWRGQPEILLCGLFLLKPDVMSYVASVA